jgi:histidine triad (HIT) family protein
VIELNKSDCIFCAIGSKTAFARIVLESDDVICFFPLEPEMLGHTLIVSKTHFHHVGDAPAHVGASVFAAAQALSRHYEMALGTAEFNLMSANGEKAEQSVQHLHFHYLPRFGDEEFSTWPVLPPFRADLDELLLKLRVPTGR